MLIDPKTLPLKDDIPRVEVPPNYKKKVLFVGEATPLRTGFSTYYINVLHYLYKTGKYDLAEFGCYLSQMDPRWTKEKIPWKYYGNLPDIIGIDKKTGQFIEDAQQRELYYKNYKENQFGKWKFSQVLLDFKPDCVIDHRDFWMLSYQYSNPFRKNIVLCQMPTVDGDPQREEWIEGYKKADYLMSYSHYGKNILEAQSGGRLKIIETAQPGIEIDIIKPVADKGKHKNKWLLNDDVFVIGTVMRNQPRKLFPHLMRAFKKFIIKYPDLGKKSCLLLHTSYPDVGWDLPRFVKRNGLLQKVLFTYVCNSCFYSFVNPWIGEVAQCRKCGEKKARLPNTGIGITRERLGEIYNLMDLYVQYSNSEGWGMGIGEAKSAGVPVLATNNTAMSEQVGEGKGGWPIELAATYVEGSAFQDTYCTRGIPSDDDFVEKLAKVRQMSPQKYQKWCREARKYAEGFSWEKTAKKWEAVLDAIPIKDRSKTWDAPPKFVMSKYRGMTEELVEMKPTIFLEKLYSDVLGRPPDEKGIKDWLSSIKRGMSREQILFHFLKVGNEQNMIEAQRSGQSMPSVDELRYLEI